jgi:hypothetical protein
MPSKNHWDCHAHRNELQVSNVATVYHHEYGQLCYAERHWDVVLWHPIRFRDRAAAQEWIEKGFIADLQESLCCLAVGFATQCLVARD